MLNNKLVLAVIPARGGSKGLKRKNIYPLLEKPLIKWTIDAAKSSKYIDEVYVSSEDDEIISISEKYGSNIIKRPTNLARDETLSDPVIEHAIHAIKKMNNNEDDFFVVFLQPTSPMRNYRHIDELIDMMSISDTDCVISVFIPSKTPFKAYVDDGCGYIKGMVSGDAPYMRRQDLPIVYYPNGAIYVFESKLFLKNGVMPRDRITPYVMSEEESIDVDSYYDIVRAEKLMLKGKSE